MPKKSLQRFINAQNNGQLSVFDQSLSELRQGRKSGLWIWFVLPQLRGIGHSEMANIYGIADLSDDCRGRGARQGWWQFHPREPGLQGLERDRQPGQKGTAGCDTETTAVPAQQVQPAHLTAQRRAGTMNCPASTPLASRLPNCHCAISPERRTRSQLGKQVGR